MMSKKAIDEDPKTYIAIVEDDESLCRSLARLLHAFGYHPVTYLSAEAFLDDAKRPAFDCLVADIQLSGMSGIELGQHLHERSVTIPLIFLTAHEEWETLKQSVKTPYAAFLRKTDPGKTVLAAIESSIKNMNHIKHT
jgi:FixJ family two-component response regulator